MGAETGEMAQVKTVEGRCKEHKEQEKAGLEGFGGVGKRQVVQML
jgi:hypothetical protein